MRTNKVLLIIFQPFEGILEGGGLVNFRLQKMLFSIFGENNVTNYYIHNQSSRSARWKFIMSSFLVFKDYWNGVTPSKIKEICKTANDYDYVFISTSVLGVIARELKLSGFKGKIITHFHNVESKYYKDDLPNYYPGKKIIVRCAYRNDYYACKYSDKIIALNERDANTLKEYYNRTIDLVIPVALEDKCSGNLKSSIQTRPRLNCLFLGSYFAANVYGITWFVENVLPFVNINLTIVGKGMSRLKENKSFSSINIVSDVLDLSFYYESADLMIMPIFSGSGMKVKTCEALMYGKNIIGTSEAFVGYDIIPERVGALSNTKEEFISAITDFTKNSKPVYNEYSRYVFETKYSTINAVKKLEQLFDY